ncbi:MAG: hypothetical protein IT385_23035 [Deltaproteobacteria bacterium]|nr:hypothetical protein [Deltaproteobacteria bacterium]
MRGSWMIMLLGACGPDVTGGADTAATDTTSTTDATAPTDGTTATDATTDTAADGVTWFSHPVPWTRSVAGLLPAPESAAIIGDLEDSGGWGNGDLFQIDFSIEVLEADAATPRRSFEPTGDWYETECDLEPVPIPSGGALEGEDGYECVNDGDCHLIVRDGDARLLYEMWRANLVGDTFYGGCLAIWDLDRAYGDTLRGRGCTSADAAGLPIAPLLFSAEEVAAGRIDHAIRFILPNDRIRHRAYVAPATHSTGATGGGPDAPPYGVRLRLRADYPLDALPSEGARVVARALQTYGMFLADAGQIALTARSDRFGGVAWEGLLGPRDLSALAVTDFEVVELGPVTPWDGECVRE